MNFSEVFNSLIPKVVKVKRRSTKSSDLHTERLQSHGRHGRGATGSGVRVNHRADGPGRTERVGEGTTHGGNAEVRATGASAGSDAREDGQGRDGASCLRQARDRKTGPDVHPQVAASLKLTREPSASSTATANPFQNGLGSRREACGTQGHREGGELVAWSGAGPPCWASRKRG